jgi:hypothetical protein
VKGEGEGAKSYDVEKAWPSIIQSTFSAIKVTSSTEAKFLDEM